MIKTRFFSLANVFLRSPLPWRWRYRQKPTPGRCRQRAVVWLAKTNFMWWKNDGGSLEAIAKKI